MKVLLSNFFLLLLCTTFICAVGFAQPKKKPAPKKKTTTTQKANVDPFGNGNATTNNDPFAPTNKKNTPTNKVVDPFAAVPNSGSGTDTTKKKNQSAPYVFIKSNTNNPLADSGKIPLRNDNGIDESYVRDRTPLVYDHIREDDAIYKQRIWSVIDTREKANLPFRNPRVEDNGSQLFFAILFKAVNEGKIEAFEDDRFTTPIPLDKFRRDYAGGLDTNAVTDLENPDKVIRYEIRNIEFPADSVYKFMVKEDVIFDKESSRMVRRILGIAPMMPLLVKGKVVEGVSNEPFPRFWIYYPDVRALLAKYRVYNPKNFGSNMSFEDLFESHMYSSYIVKSSLNNYKDLFLKEYINDPLFRLLEGEKIREKIFNYEQDLWSY